MSTPLPMAEAAVSTPASQKQGSRVRTIEADLCGRRVWPSSLSRCGTTYWAHARHFEDTDDAQIDAEITNVSPRVAGNVIVVRVVEDAYVKAGDVLAEIDPADLDIAVVEAKAKVAQAQAQLEAEDPSVPHHDGVECQRRLGRPDRTSPPPRRSLAAARKDVEQLTAQLSQAQANDRTAQLEKGRSENLVAEGAVSQSDYDELSNAAVASAANVNALAQSLAGARDRVRQQQAQLVALGSRLEEVRT